MNDELLKEAVTLAERVGHALLATTDARGIPHIASAGALSRPMADHVALDAWFCPQTLENLQANPHTAVVVWEPAGDTGYQMIGEMVDLIELSVMDGFVPGTEEEPLPPPPQVERRLVVRVDHVLTFTQAAHCDLPEEG